MRPWLAIVGALALAGCAALGGNVRGDFACKAPQGTCAPTAEIDARAVAQVARSQRAAGAAPSPAGPWVARTVQGEGLVRTGERVMRIVFLPHIDEAGNFHERSVVHAVVEGSGWQVPPDVRADGPARAGEETGNEND